jgi:hypothetical protein
LPDVPEKGKDVSDDIRQEMDRLRGSRFGLLLTAVFLTGCEAGITFRNYSIPDPWRYGARDETAFEALAARNDNPEDPQAVAAMKAALSEGRLVEITPRTHAVDLERRYIENGKLTRQAPSTGAEMQRRGMFPVDRIRITSGPLSGSEV